MIAKTSILIYLIFPILGIIQNEEPCHSRGGNCMQASRCRDSESIRSGWCPSQSANVKCCLPYQESACSALGGQCKRTDSACSGNYVSGKCPSQPSNVRCCAPSGGGGGGSGTDIFKYEPASRYSIYKMQRSLCWNQPFFRKCWRFLKIYLTVISSLSQL